MEGIIKNFDEKEAEKVKKIERVTNHDVKAVEYYIKEKLYILDRYFVWKRRIRFDSELKKSFKGKGIVKFREILQNEIYVISNRR